MLKNLNSLNLILYRSFRNVSSLSQNKLSERNTPYTIIHRRHRRCERCRENTFHPVDFSPVSFIAVFPKRINWTRCASRAGVCTRCKHFPDRQQHDPPPSRVTFSGCCCIAAVVRITRENQKATKPIRHCEIAHCVLIGRRRL